ncbi:MAG: M14 family zinc carboxypeptidase [Solirubrobacterales bacterium]
MKLLAIATAIAAALVLALSAGSPEPAGAAPDPAGCTQNIGYDSSIPTFKQVAAANPSFSTNNGQAVDSLGGFQTGTNNRHPSADLYTFQQAIADASVGNPRISVITKQIGTTFGGRPFKIAVVGTPDHIASLEDDAAFWRGVRDGSISQGEADAVLNSGDAPPAFAWVTETPHGNEPAGGESSMRLLYELAARTDCANLRRLDNMTVFVDPARNPDGRDNNTRTTAYSFDPNRDLAFQTQDVNTQALDEINKYPGLFFIDAHQQSAGYFFPPNEDPVLHEISHFALDTIQDTIGVALQNKFNDQGLQYRNYNQYDLFANEYGDAGPSMFMGAAGMTYEKGTSEVYGKQVYDHYLAMDETLNVVSKEKEELSREWVAQWQEAKEQGENCELQENTLASPLHTPPSGEISQQPDIDICGFYLKAGAHTGDVARLIDLLRGRDVKIYRLDEDVDVTGSHDFGEIGTKNQTLGAGSYWIPASQTMKHWLLSMMEEDPFIPYPYFYDVVNWSVPELWNLGGGGQLQEQLPSGVAMTELTGATALGGVTNPSSPVLAFATDSSKALGLITQLQSQGATVYRGAQAFDAAGKHFPTGTALVDGSTTGSIDLNALSNAAQTPITGLSSYPVPRYPLSTPKIGLYTGGTTEPQNPVFPGTNTPPSNGVHCTSTAYCEMVFAMAKELNIPVSMLDPITSTELAAGQLTTGNYTAFVNPGSTIAAGAGATALQTWVNGGGNYVGYNANGATSLRNAGITTLNTSATNTSQFTPHCAHQTDPTAAGSLTTPGTAYNAAFNTVNPLAWGFDEGGYIYRDSSGSAVFDGTTLGTATAAISYENPLTAYGYECNSTTTGTLPGRPYAVDQPFGLGHAAVIGSNVFFRGWTAGPQRIVMNGVLYPTATTPLRSSNKGKSVEGAEDVVLSDAKAIPSDQLPKVKNRPARVSHNPYTDAVITVKAKRAKDLKKVVRKAHLRKKIAKRIRWSRSHGKVTMTIKGASNFARNNPGDPKIDQIWTRGDLEMRPEWAWKIIRGMVRKHINPITKEI